MCNGGAERVCSIIANKLVERGYSVFVLSIFGTSDYNLDERIVKLPLVDNPSVKGLFFWLSAIKNIRKYFRKYKPNVTVGFLQYISFISYLASIGLNIPIIGTDHDAYERPNNFPFDFHTWFDKHFLPYFYDCLTVITPRDAEVLSGRFKNIEVLPNPLAIQTCKLRQLPSIRKKQILLVGRLDSYLYKGFDLAIKAFSKIEHKYPDWEMKIVGGGSQASKKHLMEIIRNEGSTSIIIEEFTHNIEKTFLASSVFLLASRYEGFGLVLIEAMSQGCVTIACDYLGRQKEIYGDYRGILVAPENIDSISSGIEKAISQHDNAALRISAIERSNYYSADNIILKWEELFARYSKI